MVNLASGLLGAILLVRHGDRLEFFQDPLTYTPSETTLTPLGTVQAFNQGDFFRQRYLQPGPNRIDGLNTDLVDINQLIVRADAAGEGNIIFESCIAFLQGFYPPTTQFSTTLANGTNVLGAMGGYQYVPIESVEPNQDISLNSFTSCPNFELHTSAFYNSPEFLAKAAEAAPFLNQLKPLLGDRDVNFTNMFNIFDFVNVNMIHNATFLQSLPPTFAAQAYDLGNFHERGVFSDTSPSGIGNIAIRTILPSIFTNLGRIANSTDPLKFALNQISYKPFISLFNITDVPTGSPDVFGIVDYASAVALEVRQPDSGEATVSLTFRNGTTTDARLLPIFNNQTAVPISQFISTLSAAAVNNTAQWCTACNQHTLRGCAACTA